MGTEGARIGHAGRDDEQRAGRCGRGKRERKHSCKCPLPGLHEARRMAKHFEQAYLDRGLDALASLCLADHCVRYISIKHAARPWPYSRFRH